MLPALVTLGVALLVWLVPASVAVDLGTPGDQRVVHGFHDSERGSGTYRWSAAKAAVELAAVPGWSVVSIRMAGHPGAGLVTIGLDGVSLATLRPASGTIRHYALLAPPASDVWGLRPLSFSTTTGRTQGDGRMLGVLVDAVVMHSVGGWSVPPALPLLALAALGGLGYRALCLVAPLGAALGASTGGALAAGAWGLMRQPVAPFILPVALGTAISVSIAVILHAPARDAVPAAHRLRAPLRARLRAHRWSDTAFLLVGLALSVALRFSLRLFPSGDYLFWTQHWYADIREQGFAVFRSGFTNYAPLYLYLLYVVSELFPSLPDVVAIKLPSLVFDYVCALFVYKVVRIKYGRGYVANLAFMVTIFAPTMVLNSAAWGQADSVYTAMLVVAVYFLLLGRQARAFLALGVAFAFKLQTIFLTPLLLVLLLRRAISWRYVPLIPLVYALSAVPSWLVGRPARDLATLYLGQAGTYEELNRNAPNMYAWFPTHLYEHLYHAGLVWAVAVCFLFVYVVFKSTVRLDTSRIAEIALLSALIMPYVLPKMHDRYFFPADMLSLVFAFFYPRFFVAAITVIMTSLLSYFPYLFGVIIIPTPILALVQLGNVLVLTWHLLRGLYPCHGYLRHPPTFSR